MGVFKRPDSPYWQIYLETTRRKEPTAFLIGETATEQRDSRRLASALYHKRMNSLASKLYKLPEGLEDISFRTYAATYERDVVAHHKGAEREREILVTLNKTFGDKPLRDIDRDAVQAWMTARRELVSAKTVNRELGLLRPLIASAVPKYLETSPIAGLKPLRTLSVKRRLLTPSEERRLLQVCDPMLRSLLVLGIDTMIRLGDLLDLRPSDRRKGWLYVRDPKGGTPYEVPLSARAARALDRLPKGTTYYFQALRVAGKPRDWRSGIRQRLKRACNAAEPKIPFGKAEGGITWHWATRRTGASRLLVTRKQPVTVVQQLGNWKTSAMLLDVYAEAQREELAAAVKARPFPSHARLRRKTNKSLSKYA